MKTALLIIDIQKDYFDGGKMVLEGAESASLNAKSILEKFRKTNLPVIHIRHIATRPDATFFLPDTPGSEINGNVRPLESEKVIIKHFPNSFRETGLFEYLKEKDITDIVICGMMTHMCIDSTVRAAKDFGFNITLIGDACATRQLELNGEKIKAKDVHNSILSALNGFYARVVNSDGYLK